MALQAALRNAQSKTPSLRTVARSKTPAQGALRTVHTKTTKTMTSLRTVTTKRLAAARVARSKTTMRVVGSRSSAEDPDALAARLAAQLAPEVAPTRSMAAVVVASPCSVATVTQHLVDELQLDAAVGFGSHREAFCEACDGANPRAAVRLCVEINQMVRKYPEKHCVDPREPQAIEPTRSRRQRRVDGMESTRHRADADTETTSRRWRGAPEFLFPHR